MTEQYGSSKDLTSPESSTESVGAKLSGRSFKMPHLQPTPQPNLAGVDEPVRRLREVLTNRPNWNPHPALSDLNKILSFHTQQTSALQKEVAELKEALGRADLYHKAICEVTGIGPCLPCQVARFVGDKMSRLEQENTQLKGGVVELEKDSKRLDWLDSHTDYYHIYQNGLKGNWTVGSTAIGTFGGEGKTIRTAIDAAINTTIKEEEKK